jgi:hypothetical protein
MNKITKIVGAIALFSATTSASASLLDFNDENNLGVALGVGMLWNGTGGGHLYNEYWDNDDIIGFSTDTYVNSFQMNAMPWENYGGGDIGSIDIAGLNSVGQTIWNTTVDLTNYTDWSNWFTVNVETADIRQLVFFAPGNAPHFNGFWPSIDNLVINEQVSQVPVPAAVWLFGSGLMGLLGFNRKRAQSAA